MKEMGGKIRVGTDYVVSRYPPPPHTIHPPHRIATILEESVIVLRRFRIPSNNIVSLLHGIICSSPTSGSQWAAYFPGLLDQTLSSELVGGRIS